MSSSDSMMLGYGWTMFAFCSGAGVAVMANSTTVSGVFGGVLVIAFAVTLGPRLVRAGLRMLKG